MRNLEGIPNFFGWLALKDASILIRTKTDIQEFFGVCIIFYHPEIFSIEFFIFLGISFPSSVALLEWVDRSWWASITQNHQLECNFPFDSSINYSVDHWSMVVESRIDPQAFLVVYSSSRISWGVSLLKENLLWHHLSNLRAHKYKRGVNCVGKFSAISRNRRRPCSDRVFVTRLKPKLQRIKIKYNIFTGKTPLAQLRWKTTTYPCRIFQHFTKRAKHVTK